MDRYDENDEYEGLDCDVITAEDLGFADELDSDLVPVVVEIPPEFKEENFLEEEVLPVETQRFKKALGNIKNWFPLWAYDAEKLIIKEVCSCSLPTAATDGRHIFFNPEFIAKLTDFQLNFVALHEVMHSTFHHFTRQPKEVTEALEGRLPIPVAEKPEEIVEKSIEVSEEKSEEKVEKKPIILDGQKLKIIWNWAIDSSIHDVIVPMIEGKILAEVVLPEKDLCDIIYLREYTGLPAEEIYARLKENPPENLEQSLKALDIHIIIVVCEEENEGEEEKEGKGKGDEEKEGKEKGDEEKEGEEDSEGGKEGKGEDRKDSKGEPKSSSKGSGKGPRVKLKVFTSDGKEIKLPDDDPLKKELEEVEREFTNYDDPPISGWDGGVGSSTLRSLDRDPAAEEASESWRSHLAQFLTKTVMMDYSWRRPNYRYFSSTGMVYPGAHSEYLEGVIYIDNSGSISMKRLREFGNEISYIRSILPEHLLHIIHVDSRINRHDLVRSGDVLQWEAKAGGANDFEIPFRYLEEQDIHPHFMIFFSDCDPAGGPPIPAEEPPYPVLWAIWPMSYIGYMPTPWGTRIEIQDKTVNF